MAPVTRLPGRDGWCWPGTLATNDWPDALYQQAFAALTGSPGARAFYDRQRARGVTHHQALRALANRLVGILHGCLTHHTTNNENTAWPEADSTETRPAA